jgi:hypothetical protein
MNASTAGNLWQSRSANDWWLTDFTRIPDASGIHSRMLPNYWQAAPYEAKGHAGPFSGMMLLANPRSNAPEIHVPLPAAVVGKRVSISIGLLVNFCDRILLKLGRDRCFTNLRHSPAAPTNQATEEVWWRDVDVRAGDTLVIAQDNGMKRRCGFSFVRLSPAPPATAGEVPIFVTVDGMPGNHGDIPLDEMLSEELSFAETHVTDICHGTDILGFAQYLTKLPDHRYWWERCAEEVQPDNEYYVWTIGQLRKFYAADRCPLRESIAAAHSIGRRIYPYFRMTVGRLFAPFRSLFEHPMYEAHPEWRCLDHEGSPVCRLSPLFPDVRKYYLDHFRENVEFGGDGLCLVFCRGWPVILYERPVADEFQRRTGKAMGDVGPDDPTLRQVRADLLTQFIREIRQTALDAAGGRPIKIVALVLADPEVNHYYGMDVETWAKEKLVDVVVPYPYTKEAKPAPIPVPEWLDALRGSGAKLCPTLNRMTYEPAGIFETPLGMLDRAEEWLKLGVDGFSFWDMDSALSLPTFRGLGNNIGSREGRQRFREVAARGPVYHEFTTFDGLRVDRYHPGWSV